MNSFLSQVVTSEDLCGCVWRYLPVKLKTKSTSQKQVQGKSSIFHCEQSQLSQPNRNQPSGKAFTVGSLWAAALSTTQGPCDGARQLAESPPFLSGFRCARWELAKADHGFLLDLRLIKGDNTTQVVKQTVYFSHRVIRLSRGKLVWLS